MTQEAIHAAIREKLIAIYGADAAPKTHDKLKVILSDCPPQMASDEFALSEEDVILITYGDMLHSDDAPALQVQHHFLKETIYPLVSTVHLLPFFPYSSDDGFSVIDYYAVDEVVGTWEHVNAMQADFRLMFDAVFNHISAKSEWFQKFLQCEAPYDEYFSVIDNPKAVDLSAVVRPRALPLLTPVETADGMKHVWTTFSDDQIDLNYANPDVLLDLIRVLLFYVQQGAELIRLDAIAFIWKEIGTTCIHLPEAHLIIQLMRDVLNLVAPDTIIITETNVPHEENISYFGDGSNEAQMVYQFPLPPLILHTMTQGDTTALTRWAQSLEPVGDRTTFFNFTASHDGIGLRPTTGLLSDDEVAALVKVATEHGGRVSYKHNADGSQSPYELNISYFDAITHPDITSENPEVAVKRFIVSQAIALSLAGVPGIYFHSLFGSRNWHEGVAQTGRNRTINRQKLAVETLRQELDTEGSIRQQVFQQYRTLLDVRRNEPVFHPLQAQNILDVDAGVFALERTSSDGTSRIMALHNVTGAMLEISLPHQEGTWRDLLSDMMWDGDSSMTLAPYQICWLKQQA